MIPGYLLGACVGADRTAVGQTLLAHPAVAAGLSGWIAGCPGYGLWLGLCLSLISQRHLPVGQERLRDHASIAVAVPMALGPQASSADWGLALLVGSLMAGPLAGLILVLRELARRAQSRSRQMIEEEGIPPLERWHFSLAGLHFARGILATALGILVLRAALTAWRALAGPAELQAASWLFLAAPMLGVPALLKGRGRPLWLLAGLVLGAILWRARGVGV